MPKETNKQKQDTYTRDLPNQRDQNKSKETYTNKFVSKKNKITHKKDLHTRFAITKRPGHIKRDLQKNPHTKTCPCDELAEIMRAAND